MASKLRNSLDPWWPVFVVVCLTFQLRAELRVFQKAMVFAMYPVKLTVNRPQYFCNTSILYRTRLQMVFAKGNRNRYLSLCPRGQLCIYQHDMGI